MNFWNIFVVVCSSTLFGGALGDAVFADFFDVMPLSSNDAGRRLDDAESIKVTLDVGGNHLEYILTSTESPLNERTAVVSSLGKEIKSYIPKEYKHGADAVLTVSTSGAIDGVFLVNGTSYHFSRPSSSSRTKVSTGGHKGKCAPPRKPPAHFDDEDRRQLKYANKQWKGCYLGENDRRIMSIGIAVGSKLAENLGEENVRGWASSLVAEASLVFEAQFNIQLEIGTLYISEKSSRPSWDSRCGRAIGTQLTSFEKWTKPSREAAWHLFDDCFSRSRSGIIGLASMGTLCQRPRRGWRDYNTGANYYSFETWLTFAHELGHTMGAGHTFENGVGNTGGIMDYGDGTLRGKYQFHENRKEELCDVVSETVDNCGGKFTVRENLVKSQPIETRQPTSYPTRRPTSFPTQKTCSMLSKWSYCLSRRWQKLGCMWNKATGSCVDRVQDSSGCYTKQTKWGCRRTRLLRTNCAWSRNLRCYHKSMGNPLSVAKTNP